MRKIRRRASPRRAAPGSTFWFRPPVFQMTSVDPTVGLYSDLILTEGDFKSTEQAAMNDTKKGAPVLERIFCHMGLGLQVTENYFSSSAGMQTTVLCEYMMWVQTDQYGSLVNSDAAFDEVLQNQRILSYGVMDFAGAEANGLPQTRIGINVHKHMDPRTKVNLREKAIGVAMRLNAQTATATIESLLTYVQPTMLVRVP